MTLLAIAEVMSGEALVSPGGPIDRDTAVADDVELWAHAEPRSEQRAPVTDTEPVLHPVLEKVLSPT